MNRQIDTQTRPKALPATFAGGNNTVVHYVEDINNII